MAQGRSTAIKRARKLLALAQSPNKHEAASAAESARALMEEYGLSEADVSEAVTEVAENSGSNPNRAELGRIVALSRGCSLLISNSGATAFRGRKEAVKSAAALYRRLALAGDVGEIPPPGYDYGDVNRAWRLCFWFGFLDILDRRLRSADTVLKEMAAAKGAAGPSPMVTDAYNALRAAEGTVDIERLRMEARVAGKRVGEAADLGEAAEAAEALSRRLSAHG